MVHAKLSPSNSRLLVVLSVMGNAHHRGTENTEVVTEKFGYHDSFRLCLSLCLCASLCLCGCDPSTEPLRRNAQGPWRNAEAAATAAPGLTGTPSARRLPSIAPRATTTSPAPMLPM